MKDLRDKFNPISPNPFTPLREGFNHSFLKKSFPSSPLHIFYFKEQGGKGKSNMIIAICWVLGVQDTRGGELCLSKCCQIFANSQQACLDRLFLTPQKTQFMKMQNTIFKWKISSPTEVKNHDIPPVGFSLNPLNEL